MTRESCPSCGSNFNSVFHELSNVPAQSVMLIPTREIAFNFPRGDIALELCQDCGFVYNAAFNNDLLEYSSTYESTQSYSPTFNAFAQSLAKKLIHLYDLRNKTILEIGCGNGEFLTLLCELGGNRGIGFDPAYVEDRADGKVAERVSFIKDYYSEKYSNYAADFICCKMTLEHIQHTADFIGTVRRAVGKRNDTTVFFQIPDATRILTECSFEDIYYEHCSYFTPGSLARLFRRSEFDVLNLETDYDGQYLMLEAKPAARQALSSLPEEEDLSLIKEYVKEFPEKFESKVAAWKRRLNDIYRNGNKAVLWGSGSKAVAFLTTLKVYDEIDYVVDINPHRHGTYMAGTGQEIVGPQFLKEYRPDVVIIMNSVYRDEIEHDLHQMNLAPRIFTL